MMLCRISIGLQYILYRRIEVHNNHFHLLFPNLLHGPDLVLTDDVLRKDCLISLIRYYFDPFLVKHPILK